MKLNILLAKSEHSSQIWKNLLSAYTGFFKTKQGAFKGERKTYTPADGTIDEPSKRGNTIVVTTVGEKLIYMESTVGDYLNNLLSIEATNASGNAAGILTIEGTGYRLSTIELMRLKGVLEELKGMYEEIPVRPDNELWVAAANNDDNYGGRSGIFQGTLAEGVSKSTLKESIILIDPNVVNLKDSTKYTPVTGSRDTVITLGSYTHQKYTGEWSQRERALLLDRRSKLLEAVIVALKEANEVEQVVSTLNSQILFGYLHS